MIKPWYMFSFYNEWCQEDILYSVRQVYGLILYSVWVNMTWLRDNDDNDEGATETIPLVHALLQQEKYNSWKHIRFQVYKKCSQ